MKNVPIKPINNDFNLFKNFYYVAKTGSFSKAAQELFVSQPSVSYNVKCLEENLGCKLLHRFSKGIKLTEDGEAVLSHIEKAYNSILLAERCILNNKELKTGSLTIGGPSYILGDFLLPTINNFCQKFPAIKINLISLPGNELVDFLKSNRIDILIDALPDAILDGNITSKKLWSKTTCFAGLKEFSKPFAKLEWQNFLFPERRSEEGRFLFEQLSNNYSTVKMEVSSPDVMLNLTKAGFGIGFFLSDFIEKELENGTLKKISTPLTLPKINISCFYIKDFLNYAADAFLKEIFSEI